MKYKKIVLKVGTSVLAKEDGDIDRNIIENIVSQVVHLLDKNVKVIIVSSGAISAGRGILKSRSASNSLSDLQAMASVGQSQLMHLYREAFKKRGYLVGQILLTQDDFDDRKRYLNIKYTIDALISNKPKQIVPIVNENDTVSTEEIKLGDNDKLSSLVADLSEADALIMLTDVMGLYDKEDRVIENVEDISDEIEKAVGKKLLSFTKGGMVTKLEAARRVMHSDIDCFIAKGTKPNIISHIAEGNREIEYTYFKAKKVKEKAKKRWIAHSSKIKGKIVVDEGAKQALIKSHKSLLASGVTGNIGNFKAGDVVGITDSGKKEFARGLTNYSSQELERIKGLKTGQIESALGYKDHDEVVHRDNLVML